MQVRRFLAISFLLELLICCQAPAANVNSEEALEAELAHAKILGPQAHFKANLHGDTAVVFTDRLPQATDSDYKINAVLIAKKTMGFCGKQVTKVRVIFRDPAQPSEIILALIRQGDIKAYGSKLESKDELLSSIDLVKRSERQSSQGPVMLRTMADVQPALRQIDMHIESLANRGVDVKPFQKMYDELEHLTKTARLGAIAAAVAELREKLAEQEQSYRAAHRRRVIMPRH